MKDLKNVTFTEEESQESQAKQRFFEPTKREEEKRLHELQKQQRAYSLKILGYDVLDSHCPYCQEKYSLLITDEGKEIPKALRFISFFVPRLRRTEVTLHCVSCDKDYKTPSLLSELSIPLLLVLFILAIALGDYFLISYLCYY